MIKNPSFEDSWTDLPPSPGNLINQQPNDWLLKWINEGDPLFDSDDVASGVPECRHLHKTHLPADEQPGTMGRLILDGDWTYKIFHGGAPFGASLTQVVDGLTPGSIHLLTVPILVDLHGDGDWFGAESRVLVDGEGDWVTGGEMQDRKWHYHAIPIIVPSDGRVTIEIQVKSKWHRPKDFFIDGLSLGPILDPPVIDCAPRVPYRREYWVTPPGISKAHRDVIYAQASAAKVTCGPSYDDAGYGAAGLSNNTAVLYGIASEDEQSMIDWFNTHYPGTRVVFANLPGGYLPPFEFGVYPVDALLHVTQPWGANPQNYTQFGLPGHDGVDLRAPHGTRIFAVADGRVSRVDRDPAGHNYGIHVRIDHTHDYQTIYAHLLAAHVSVGDWVKTGDVVGLADSTGNSRGDHLHLGLKRIGHTYTDHHGTWPYNLHDPMPYLSLFFSHPVMLGLHTSTTPDISDEERTMFREFAPDLIKVMSPQQPADEIGRLAADHPDAHYIVRVFYSFGGRDQSPQTVATETIPSVQAALAQLPPNRIIELLNEPNLYAEGLGSSWATGDGFNVWYLEFLRLYRSAMPGERFMFSGLSPGGDLPGVRQDSDRFMDACAQAIAASDALGVHAYFAPQSGYPVSDAINEVKVIANRFLVPEIWVTESANNQPGATPAETAAQIVQFWQGLSTIPQVRGVTYFVASAPDDIWNWDPPHGTGQTWLPVRLDRIVSGLL